MVDWPKDDKEMDFEDLTAPIYRALNDAYTMTPKDYGDIPWTGPSLPKSMGATCLPFDKALTKEMLDYDRDDQGRDALTVIMGIAVALGIEQGRRIYVNSFEHKIMKMSSQETADALNRLADQRDADGKK